MAVDTPLRRSPRCCGRNLSLRASSGRDLRGECSNQCISCLKDSGSSILFTKSKIADEVGPRTPRHFVTNPSFNTIYVVFFHVPYVSYGKPGCSSYISPFHLRTVKTRNECLNVLHEQKHKRDWWVWRWVIAAAVVPKPITARDTELSLRRALHKGCVQLPTTKYFNSQGSLIREMVNDITCKPLSVSDVGMWN